MGEIWLRVSEVRLGLGELHTAPGVSVVAVKLFSMKSVNGGIRRLTSNPRALGESQLGAGGSGVTD
jgi:hypothetical protein